MLLVFNLRHSVVSAYIAVPPEDIVLGLQAPYKRQYTDYGVA
ncbi:hypothetical protein OGM63_23135 [Plectonema radiosum NIES-515]|uniref:Uncharacterized protein n=1 Tax=Plectonema radiosum NIES-515 TaxID=2986073 RepID=A0ABT3B563_9CYAN|nr:element excision factor XisI family protein [Plectonema radiosum]MCV3216370.1 hypothetical protein [Plectonema radiosum NIES-515]